MFTTILSAAQQALLERLSAVTTVRTFYLAGGTALALHLGHRRSVDFDFFRPESFDPAELIRSLNPVGTLAVQRAERDMLTVQITDVATSFFAYPYALLQPVVASPWSVSVGSIGDIAAMKLWRLLAVAHARTSSICTSFVAKSWGLPAALQLFEEKFRGVPYERYHILKSLTFFDDADAEVMPAMLRPASWPEIKHFFVAEVPSLFTAG